jgi:hypothetical protein
MWAVEINTGRSLTYVMIGSDDCGQKDERRHKSGWWLSKRAYRSITTHLRGQFVG